MPFVQSLDAPATPAAPGEGLPALLARLQTSGPQECRHLIGAIAALGGQAAAQALVSLFGAAEAAIRCEAVEGLRRMGAQALPVLTAALRAQEADLRIFAINVLDSQPSPAARALLRELLEGEDDMNVCMAAVEALAMIGLPEDATALRALRDRFAGQPFADFALRLALRQIGAEAGR